MPTARFVDAAAALVVGRAGQLGSGPPLRGARPGCGATLSPWKLSRESMPLAPRLLFAAALAAPEMPEEF